MLATVERIKAATQFLIEPGQLSRTCMIVLLQKSQRFSYDLTCRVIAPRSHFGADEFF